MAWGNRSHGVNDLVAQLNQNCTAETMCVMRSRIFGEEEALLFSKALSNNTSLKNLLLNGHHISVTAATEFGGSLALNNVLQELTIGDDKFGDEGLIALINGGLDRNRSITCLDFEFRSLGPSSAIALGSMLSNEESPPLKKMILGRNNLAGDVDAFGMFLDGVRKHRFLVTLDISNNSSSLVDNQEKASQIASQLGRLKGHETLQRLVLNNNVFGSSVGPSLAVLVDGGIPHLSELDISNCGLTDSVILCLSEAFGEEASSLKKLDLSSNDITTQGAVALARTITSSASLSSLETLILSSNKIGDGGADAFAEVISGGSKEIQLIVLDVARNDISGAGAASLVGASNSESDKGLNELILLGNDLGNEGAALISNVLISSTLASLDLTGTNMSVDCLEYLLPAVEMSNIKTLALGGNKVGASWKELQSFSKRTCIDVVFDLEQPSKEGEAESDEAQAEVPGDESPKEAPKWVEHVKPETVACSPVDVSHLHLGDNVIIRRLSTAVKFNELRGIVGSGLINGRISVWLEKEQKSIAVRPENLDKE